MTLSDAEALALALALQIDAKDYFQCGVISFVDALCSIERGFYSWATVKLYYAVFYALRARLALSGDCIFHVVTKPKVISARAGASTAKLPGNTHKAVLKRFQTIHSSDYFLSQDIAGEDPLDWFVDKREDANYRSARFVEPDIPPYFEFARHTPIRQMLTAYLSDDVYVFDAEHAMIAFPFKLLRSLRASLRVDGLSPLLPSEIDFLKEKLRDRAGDILSAETIVS
jgi:hypothetical protein